jgi:hypothetical protein
MDILENYEVVEFGIIKQQKIFKIEYNYQYSSQYNSYGSMTKYLSCLRLGILIDTIKKIPSSILDVGYGNGSFLSLCSNTIPKCFGNDLHQTYKLPNNCEFVDNIFEKEFEVITFFDSFEHFDDIFIVDKLKCNYIMISLPFCHYFSNEWFEKWVHRRPNEHLWHFNDKSLISFFESYGYKCIHQSNFEDVIRKRETYNNSENILTCIFEKK